MYCIFNIKIQKYYSLFHVICISTEINYYQSHHTQTNYPLLYKTDNDNNDYARDFLVNHSELGHHIHNWLVRQLTLAKLLSISTKLVCNTNQSVFTSMIHYLD